MPLFSGRLPGVSQYKLRNFNGLSLWLAICTCILAPACFYIGPIVVLDSNMPPVILAATNYDDVCLDDLCQPIVEGSKTTYCGDCQLPLIIDSDFESIFVLISDEDLAQITYIWTLSDWGLVTNHQPFGESGSLIELDNDPDLDGQILTCQILDGSTYKVELNWSLDVP